MSRRHFQVFRNRPALARPRSVRQETEEDRARDELARFFYTINPPLGGKRLEKLPREDAERLIRTPDSFRRITQSCSDAHMEELEPLKPWIQGMLRDKIEMKDAVRGETDRPMDSATIWTEHAGEIERVRAIAKRQLADVDATIAEVRQCSAKLAELMALLPTLVCSDNEEVAQRNKQLGEVLKQTDQLIARVSRIEQTIRPIELERIDINEKAKAVDESRSELIRMVREINSAVEEFNKKVTQQFRMLKCKGCILKKFVKAYYDHWQTVRWLRLLLSNDFPNLSKETKTTTKALGKEIDDKLKELEERRKVHQFNGAVHAMYAANRERIRSVNDCIKDVNRMVLEVARATEDLRRCMERVPSCETPNFTEVEGDLRHPETLIKLLEQSRTIRKFYLQRLTAMREVLGGMERSLDQMRERCQGIVSRCETTERFLGVHSVDKEMRGVTGRSISIDEAIVSLSNGAHLRELIERRMPYPEELVDLAKLLAIYGKKPGPLAKALNEFEELDRELTSPTDEVTVQNGLKRLRRNAVYEFLLSGTLEIFERALISDTDDEIARAVVNIYLARRDCETDIETELHRRAWADLLRSGKREKIVMDGVIITREELVRSFTPRLNRFLETLSLLIRENDQYLMDHAAKHAGFRVDRPVPVDREEIELWRMVRRGDGPLSAAALRIKHGNNDDIRTHYARVARRTAIHSAPLLAGFGYPFITPGVKPVLLFAHDLTDDGLEHHLMYTSFGLDNMRWRTTFITSKDEFEQKGKISLITPIPKTTLL
ncbi:Uncharacterised protein [Candidatus Bilamarchaeum dharawalense]|uniref:Uncharacterized protein n=1 Tax=Candidatus Bilamarchaeum dharawalense TaxID=2885759 RepID=A0A5E4LTC3_9ARCH|nr:Uncharacterised protein [Candidatus Bilamarchaeum dharawalense]